MGNEPPKIWDHFLTLLRTLKSLLRGQNQGHTPRCPRKGGDAAPLKKASRKVAQGPWALNLRSLELLPKELKEQEVSVEREAGWKWPANSSWDHPSRNLGGYGSHAGPAVPRGRR